MPPGGDCYWLGENPNIHTYKYRHTYMYLRYIYLTHIYIYIHTLNKHMFYIHKYKYIYMYTVYVFKVHIYIYTYINSFFQPCISHCFVFNPSLRPRSQDLLGSSGLWGFGGADGNRTNGSGRISLYSRDTPRQTNMDTQNDGFGKGGSFQIWLFWVSMLNFGAVGSSK